MIQGVILVGGLGTRLRPLTETVPKPLVLVCGKPFLQHQLEMLKSFGISDFVLLVSYLGWKIEECLGDGSKLGLHIQYSREASPLGTGGALKNAEGKLDETFLLLNGDTYLPTDYRLLIQTFREKDVCGLLVAYRNAAGEIPNNLALDTDGRVTAYNKRSPQGLTHVDAGAVVLSKRVLDLIPPGCIHSLEEDVYPKLIQWGELWAVPTSQPFYDMGTVAGLEALAEALS